MKPTATKIALYLVAISAIQGCSGPHQDPRVSLCRNLAASLIEPTRDVLWTSAGEEIVRPEFARVKVTTSDGASASCFYEYDAVEEDALTHSDPLSAYATLPYKMTLNGTQIPALKLKRAVISQQTKIGKDAVEQAQKAIDSAAQHIQKSLDSQQTN